ncbi:MAG: HAD family hydrolase [Lachnospiraceae bacterium]|nr:HAD family hydrolase [Ruminococcus sp.]MCM1274826.1 HAD family hydrolase [Lachnospiraceae bacterium]
MTDNKTTIDNIIFDMDGTLWDSSENVAKSWNEAVRGLADRRFTAEDIQSVMGLPMDKIAERFFPEAAEETRLKILERCCEGENAYLRAHGGEIYPDTAPVLGELSKSCRLFIVSNCQAGYIEAFLDYYGLWKYITDRLCWGDNGLQKSENIRLIMQRNNAENALYVGDTQGDCDSAYAAGARFAFAAYGFGDADRCDIKLNRLSELAEKLKNLC